MIEKLIKFYFNNNRSKYAFNFKGYTIKQRISNKGNLCLVIFKHKALVAEAVMHNGQIDVIYFGNGKNIKQNKLIFRHCDAQYGRNNFLKDNDAYRVLDRIISHIKAYEKRGYTYQDIDFRELNKVVDELMEATKEWASNENGEAKK